MKRVLLILCVLALLLSGCAFAAADSDALPIATRNQIKRAMSAKMNTDYSGYVDEDPRYVCGMRYYGTYNGYAVLFEEGGLTMMSSIRIGNEVFEHSSSFNLLAFRDGKFQSLKDVYEAGDISDRDIVKISNIHRNFKR